jgi:hypothetical protein
LIAGFVASPYTIVYASSFHKKLAAVEDTCARFADVFDSIKWNLSRYPEPEGTRFLSEGGRDFYILKSEPFSDCPSFPVVFEILPDEMEVLLWAISIAAQ